MSGSSREYPKGAPTHSADGFPERHVDMKGKGSAEEVLNYMANPMGTITGGPPQEARVRNVYAKNGAPSITPTPEQITPPVDPSGPAIDSSVPARTPW